MCCQCRKRNSLRLPPYLRRYLCAQREELRTFKLVQKVIASTFPLQFILTPPDFWAELSGVSGWRSSPVSMGSSLKEVCGTQSTCSRLRPCPLWLRLVQQN